MSVSPDNKVDGAFDVNSKLVVKMRPNIEEAKPVHSGVLQHCVPSNPFFLSPINCHLIPVHFYVNDSILLFPLPHVFHQTTLSSEPA